MALYTLVIGSKNYSSWSMRAWLGLRHAGIEFDEIVIPLDANDTRERILVHSPAGLVPVLKTGCGWFPAAALDKKLWNNNALQCSPMLRNAVQFYT